MKKGLLVLLLLVTPLGTWAADLGTLSEVRVGGVAIHNGDTVPVDSIAFVNSNWIFNFTWPNFVHFTRATFAVFRGTFGNIEGGTLQLGSNYGYNTDFISEGNNNPTSSVEPIHT